MQNGFRGKKTTKFFTNYFFGKCDSPFYDRLPTRCGDDSANLPQNIKFLTLDIQITLGK